jgi:hypothetical protein
VLARGNCSTTLLGNEAGVQAVKHKISTQSMTIISLEKAATQGKAR